MAGGYILGLLALPISRGLEKPGLLKWWLRIDFWFSLIPAVIALPLLFYCGRHFIVAEDGDYVLYEERGIIIIVNNIDGALLANDLPKRFLRLNLPLSFFSVFFERF